MRNPLLNTCAATLAFAVAALSGNQSTATDATCEGLVVAGDTLICAGFEPNWALELTCNGVTMSATFIDAFSGGDIRQTRGSVAFSTHDPWTLSTSHGIRGSIAYTPAGCTDESGASRDYTFTPTAAPGLDGPFYPFCCRRK